MTDIPALFFFLLSIYGFVRVAEVLDTVTHDVKNGGGLPLTPALPMKPLTPTLSPSDGERENKANTFDVVHGFEQSSGQPWRGRFFGWLSLGLVAGVLGGSVRQIGWLVPTLAPLLLIVRRRSLLKVSAAVIPLLCSMVVTVAAALLLSAWFNAQPYTIHEKLTNGLSALHSVRALPYLTHRALWLTLTLGALVVPMLLVLPRLYQKWLAGRPTARTMLLTALLVTTVLAASTVLVFGDRWDFPFLGNTFVRFPFLTGTDPIVPAMLPLTLPRSFWRGFSGCVIALVSGSIALWIGTLFWKRSEAREQSHLAAMSPVVALLGIFVAAYIPILLFKSAVPDSFGIRTVTCCR